MSKQTNISIHLIIFIFFLLPFTKALGKHGIDIIPQPTNIEVLEGSIQFDSITITINDKSLEHLKSYVEKQLNNQFDIELTSGTQSGGKNLFLELNDGFENDEAYSLSISSNDIKIEASDPHGAFNGIQSLVQLLYDAKNESGIFELRQCKITDSPRFSWRGYMLDESRHFYGKEKVKQTLDLMALHKLNIFHWHLTDAPGWRIEIKKYPKLTEVGSKGNQSDPTAPAAFYTQEEIKDIVAYAAERYIQIIPEIDMPGHLSAAMLAYPEYSGGGTKRHPNFTINPGMEESYQFLTDILKEVSILFPAPYIHIGGDEVSFGNKQWAVDPFVKELQKQNNLADLMEVEHYFINRMYDTIMSMQKKFIGWDEVANASVDKENSIVMWWRHDKEELLPELIDKDYQVILCPRIPLYLDFDQDEKSKYGRRWAGEYCELEKVYNFPNELNINFTSSNIHGVQGNLWTNRISSEDSNDYMTWPRLSAVAEVAWSADTEKNFNHFLRRLKKMHNVYDIFGLYYFDYFQPLKRDEPEDSWPPRWQENHMVPED
jgi:hexosaminidase